MPIKSHCVSFTREARVHIMLLSGHRHIPAWLHVQTVVRVCKHVHICAEFRLYIRAHTHTNSNYLCTTLLCTIYNILHTIWSTLYTICYIHAYIHTYIPAYIHTYTLVFTRGQEILRCRPLSSHLRLWKSRPAQLRSSTKSWTLIDLNPMPCNRKGAPKHAATDDHADPAL